MFKEVCKVSIPFQERNFGIKTFTLLWGFLREFSFLYIKFISIKNLSEIACGVNTTSCNARKSIFKLWKTRYSFQGNGKKVFYLKVRTNFQALNLANLRNLKQSYLEWCGTDSLRLFVYIRSCLLENFKFVKGEKFMEKR